MWPSRALAHRHYGGLVDRGRSSRRRSIGAILVLCHPRTLKTEAVRGASSLIVAAILMPRSLLVAANLHLSEDEAYYRLWSMAPALGYYDHPPMIAWWIAIGRALSSGDTPLGVRLMPALGSAAISLLVFDMARLTTGADRLNGRAGGRCGSTAPCLSPAARSSPCRTPPPALFWCLTLVVPFSGRSDPGGARSVGGPLAGVAAGLATLSKYSALFLGPGHPALADELRRTGSRDATGRRGLGWRSILAAGSVRAQSWRGTRPTTG